MKRKILPVGLGVGILAGFLLGASPAHAFTLGGTDPDLRGWRTKLLTFRVNHTGCTVPDSTLDTAIDMALDLWNGVPSTSLKLARGADTATTVAQAKAGTATDTPEILCDTAFSTTYPTADADFVVGVGQFATRNSEIGYGFLVLNAEAGKDGNIANYGLTALAAILAHEMGHVLGLGHSADSSALMYYSSSRTEMALAQDDIDGITYLYPRSEPDGSRIFGCGTLAVVGSGRGGGGRGGSGHGGKGRAGGGPFGGGDDSGGASGASSLAAFFLFCAAITRLAKNGPRLAS